MVEKNHFKISDLSTALTQIPMMWISIEKIPQRMELEVTRLQAGCLGNFS